MKQKRKETKKDKTFARSEVLTLVLTNQVVPAYYCVSIGKWSSLLDTDNGSNTVPRNVHNWLSDDRT